MRFSWLLLSAGLCVGAHIPDNSQSHHACRNPETRVEWRTLSRLFQTQYIDSVLCLKSRPSRLGLNTTLYDDFPYIHTNLNNIIHWVAMFLPWHRNFVHLYEQALRECGYTGPMAYWDWSLDSANVPESPIWDPQTGFGGNGDPNEIELMQPQGERKCVSNGPLKDLRLSYYGNDFEPHCLARNWNNGTETPGDMISWAYTPDAVNQVLTAQTYPDFRSRLEAGPHGAIHSAVGGDMSPGTSPNDPIFFLHHVQIDRLWYLWQQEDPRVRNTAFGGPRTQAEDSLNATLTDIMPFMGLGKDITVSQMMTTQTSRLCYVY